MPQQGDQIVISGAREHNLKDLHLRLPRNALVVITGLSGGEFGIRGRVTAFDAATGKERCRFYTIPAPADTGGD